VLLEDLLRHVDDAVDHRNEKEEHRQHQVVVDQSDLTVVDAFVVGPAVDDIPPVDSY
jgi:hypothetical protein